MLLKFLVFACVGSLTLTPIAHAQQSKQTGPKAKTKVAVAKQVPPDPTFVLTNGLWSGLAIFKSGESQESSTDNIPEAIKKRMGEMAKPKPKNNVVSFTIKDNLLTGEGTVPIHQDCNASHVSASFVTDFSKLTQFSGPNSFGATFSVENYKIVLKGTFLSSSSASGSISVTSLYCATPTVYTWEASPQAALPQ